MKKWTRTISFLLVVVLFWTGCSAAENTNSGENHDAKDQAKKVELVFWKAKVDPVWTTYWEGAIKRYEEQNPGVTISYTETPNGQPYDTKLNAAYASGTSPDIMMAPISVLAQRAEMGQYEALDEYIDHWADKGDMMEAVFTNGEYKDKSYALAIYPVPALFAYRKDFFQEAGLDPESPPTSWDELAAFAEQMTERDGNTITRSGMSLPIDSFKFWLPFAQQIGYPPVSMDGKEALDHPALIESLTYLTELFKDKKVSAIVNVGQENKQSLFSQGKAAISVAEPTWIKQIIEADASLKDKIGFFWMKRDKEALFSGADMLYISSKSKLKEEAWKFIEFAMTGEEMQTRYEQTQAPVLRKSLQEQYINDNPFMNQAIIKGIEIGEGVPKVPWAPLYMKYLRQAREEAFYGKKSAEQALKDAQETLMKELANQ